MLLELLLLGVLLAQDVETIVEKIVVVAVTPGLVAFPMPASNSSFLVVDVHLIAVELAVAKENVTSEGVHGTTTVVAVYVPVVAHVDAVVTNGSVHVI